MQAQQVRGSRQTGTLEAEVVDGRGSQLTSKLERAGAATDLRNHLATVSKDDRLIVNLHGTVGVGPRKTGPKVQYRDGVYNGI